MPTQLDRIENVVTGSLAHGGPIINLGDVKSVTDVLGGIFGGGGGLDFEAILKKFFESDVARDAFKTLVDKLSQALQSAEDICKNIAELVAVIINEFIKVLQEIISKLEKAVSDLFNSLGGSIAGALPQAAFFQGPKDAMTSLTQLQALLAVLGRTDDIAHRVTVSFSSIHALTKIATGSQMGDFLFGSFADSVKDSITQLLGGTDPAKIITDGAKAFLLPGPLLKRLFDAVAHNKFWLWADLPSGLGPGKLHTWLNDFGNGEFQQDAAVDDQVKHPLERQFRIRLAANVDAYFRKAGQGFIAQHGLRISDERVSTQILTDLITILCDTTITFALEPECYPSTDLDWDHFEDVGMHFAAMTGRQIKAAVRTVTGTVMRGIWLWSVKNENLMEAIGTIIGSILTSLLEGIVRNLAWTFRIVSRYENDSVSPAIEVWHWEGGEFYDKIPGPSQQDGRVQYVALLRSTPNAVSQAVKDAVNNNALVKGLLQDIGAYADLSYRQFLLDSRFPAIQADAVNITFIGSAGGQLLVKATTDSTDAPRPVLRAYVCCQIVVMTPPASVGGEYEAFFDVSHLPGRITVTVLSNRGGSNKKSQSFP